MLVILLMVVVASIGFWKLYEQTATYNTRVSTWTHDRAVVEDIDLEASLMSQGHLRIRHAEGSTSVAVNDAGGYTIGEMVEVVVDPKDPSRVQIIPLQRSLSSFVLGPGSLVVLLIMLALTTQLAFRVKAVAKLDGPRCRVLLKRDDRSRRRHVWTVEPSEARSEKLQVQLLPGQGLPSGAVNGVAVGPLKAGEHVRFEVDGRQVWASSTLRAVPDETSALDAGG